MIESQFYHEDVQCPVCLYEEPTTKWTVINAATDPDLKDRLLRKQIHQQICSNCGHLYLIAQPLLYLDPANRLILYAHPDLSASRIPDEVVAELPVLGGWTMRLVGDANQLIEKIHIVDHHCDDRIMELVKLAILRQGSQLEAGQADAPVMANLFFLTANDAVMRFMVMDADQSWYSLDLDAQIYLNTEQLVHGFLDETARGWQIIGRELAVKWLRRLAEA
jgi:hypothetical protein